MNAPVVVRHLSCSNELGNGRYLAAPIKVDLSTHPKDGFNDAVESLKIVKDDLKNRSKSSPVDVDDYYCSSSSSTDSSACPVEQKSVRFATDKKGRVLRKVYRNYEPRTRKEVSATWYAPVQFMSFRKDCRKEAIMMQKTSYAKKFAAVYEACNNGNFKAVTKERAYVSAASCRGLEVILFPTLHADRKNAIHTLLKTQDALPKDMPLAKRQDALATASRFLSKQARQLSRVLGSGDAAVVVANDRIAASQKNALKSGNVPQSYTSTK